MKSVKIHQKLFATTQNCYSEVMNNQPLKAIMVMMLEQDNFFECLNSNRAIKIVKNGKVVLKHLLIKTKNLN